jgi:hypothetical protein
VILEMGKAEKWRKLVGKLKLPENGSDIRFGDSNGLSGQTR